MDVGNSGDGHYGTDAGFPDLRFIQAVKLIKFAHLYFYMFAGIVMVADDDFLVDPDGAVVHLSDADASHIFIVIDGADEHLGAGGAVAFRGGNVVYNGFKQRFHADAGLGRVRGGHACLCGSVNKGAVQLGIVCIQFQEQFQYFIHNFFRPCLRAVNFIDAHDDGQL